LDDSAAEEVKISMSPAAGRSFKKIFYLNKRGSSCWSKDCKVFSYNINWYWHVEQLTEFVSGSVVATADGIDSI
jgi:hypothetical protein